MSQDSSHGSHRSLHPGKEIGNYRLLKRIAKGGFGSIWLVREQSTNSLLAMKAEKTKHKMKTLPVEKKVIKDVQGEPYFPTYYEEAQLPHYDLIFMECLGPSLRKLRHKTPENRFSLSTSMRSAIEMLRCIRALHKRGYIHRDIKPDNFVVRPSRSAPIALIDYGLSRRYLTDDGQLVPLRVRPGFVGTEKFASETAHLALEQTRRDDVEAWYYTIIQLLKGSLPWSKLTSRDLIFQTKKDTDFYKLLHNYPSQLAEVYSMIPEVGSTDEPPYDDIIMCLEEGIEENHMSWDEPYDWELLSEKRMRRLTAINMTPPTDDSPMVPVHSPIEMARARAQSQAVFTKGQIFSSFSRFPEV